MGSHGGKARGLAAVPVVVALIFACALILRDVAARHRAEEALGAEHHLLLSIIDTIPDHVYVKDVEGRFILDNVAHRDMYGPKTEGTTTGRELTFNIADDTIIVDSGNGSRTLTRHRVQR